MRHRVTRLRLLPLLAIVLAFGMPAATALAASSGALDSAFGAAGYTTLPIGSLADAIGVVVQPDGKIVTAGEAQLSNGDTVMFSTRMNGNGTLDTGYGNGGTVSVDINGATGANAVALQPDGKIVLGGTGRDPNTYGLAFAAVRLLPNGALDPSFGKGGIVTVPIGVEAIANAVAIEPGGQIVLGGSALQGHAEFAAVRLTASGALDPTFGSSGVSTLSPTAAAWGMVLQPDGAIVLAGQADYQNTQAYMAARLSPRGTLDPTFGTNGIVTIPIGVKAIGNAVARQADGKIVLAGNAWVNNTGVAATVRLTANGRLDPSFGTSGIATQTLYQAVNAMTIQPDGRIVLAATGTTTLRLNTDGSPDQTFGTNGTVLTQIGTSDAANGVTIEPSDGKVILAGCATLNNHVDVSVIRLQGQSSAGAGHPPASPATTPSVSSTSTARPAGQPSAAPAVSTGKQTTRRAVQRASARVRRPKHRRPSHHSRRARHHHRAPHHRRAH